MNATSASSHPRANSIGWYLFAIFHELVPIYPLYGIMFVERGLSPSQLSLLFGWWTVVALVAEVPSGGLADAFPRKRLLVAASLLKAMTYLVWLVVPSFWGYLLGFTFWGVSGALRSGTWESLIHDTLHESGHTALFTRIFGRARACSVASIACAMVAGGWLMRFGYETVLVVSAGTLLVSALVAAILFREPRTHEAIDEGHYFALLTTGLREATTNRKTRFIAALSLALVPLAGVFDEYVGPTLYEKGCQPATAGYLFAVMYVAQIGGALAAHRFRNMSMVVLMAVFFAAGIVLLPAAFGNVWVACAAMALYFAAFSLGSTLLAGKLQHAIEGVSRATVTSVSGAAAGVGSLMSYGVYGWVATDHGMAGGVLFISVASIVLSTLFALGARVSRLT